MSILVGRNTKLITVGFTGKQGTYHSLQSRDYGTSFVGGVSPGKGNTIHEGYPVFNTVFEAKEKTDANAAMVLVPPEACADAILECIDAAIPLIVCVSEGIPQHDMLKVLAALKDSNCRLIGPNSPGIITPGESKVGIMPGHIFMPGKVGILSRSGTLTYEIVYNLTNQEIGQSSCVGIGGDGLCGTNFIEILSMFEADKDTEVVVMLGEVGGTLEAEAAEWIKHNMTKPVIAYIAGRYAPKGKRLGHAGAIIYKQHDTAEVKRELLSKCGVKIAETPYQIAELIKDFI